MRKREKIMNLRNPNGTMNWSNADEIIFSRNHLIGVEELDTPFREIPFQQLMEEFCEDYYDCGCGDFAVVFDVVDEEVHIMQVYNHETGEVYWEDNFEEDTMSFSGRDWSSNDEILYCSLLMWGNLEQQIGC
tara:strand:- start:83 stop:478 length:396 start_codon:yes stop_codon:yes gene_type:complete